MSTVTVIIVVWVAAQLALAAWFVAFYAYRVRRRRTSQSERTPLGGEAARASDRI